MTDGLFLAAGSPVVAATGAVATVARARRRPPRAGRGAARGACAHLGGPTGGTVSCPTCRGRVELKVFACAVHGTCTLGRRSVGHAACPACPDHRPA